MSLPNETQSFAPTHAQHGIAHVDQSSFEQQVLRSDVPVLVDFYADWCGPCQMLTPKLEELARELPNARIVKVNVDDNPHLAARYSISAIPTLLVFRNGRIAAQHVGLASKSYLKAILSDGEAL